MPNKKKRRKEKAKRKAEKVVRKPNLKPTIPRGTIIPPGALIPRPLWQKRNIPFSSLSWNFNIIGQAMR